MAEKGISRASVAPRPVISPRPPSNLYMEDRASCKVLYLYCPLYLKKNLDASSTASKTKFILANDLQMMMTTSNRVLITVNGMSKTPAMQRAEAPRERACNGSNGLFSPFRRINLIVSNDVKYIATPGTHLHKD